jgi:predicted RNase H-like HicB family nuclease
MHLTAVFRKVPHGYVGFVEEVPGARTRGKSLAEVRASLAQKVELVLEANRAQSEKSIKGKKVIRETLSLPVGMKPAELLRHLQKYS